MSNGASREEGSPGREHEPPSTAVRAAALVFSLVLAASVPTPSAAAADNGSHGNVLQQAADTVASDSVTGDTIPGDTVPGDTLPTDSLPAAPPAGDTTGGERGPYFPEALPVPDSGYSAVVWRCDRECLLDHSAHNLLDLLEAEWPGAVPLRGTYFGGPHHLATGLAGSAFTEVSVEELPLPELSGGQLDLSRVPLAWLSEVAIIRRAGQLELRLEPVRHRSPQAYSRVTVGSGQPNLRILRGLFTNGLGDHMSVSTGIDLLNTEGALTGSDRLDFWGMASWMPGDESGGAELLWRTQNMTRFAPESGAAGGEDVPGDFTRRDAYLRGRGSPAEGVRVHVSAGRSEWKESTGTAGTGAPGAGGVGSEEESARPEAETEGGSLAVQADRPWGFGHASFRTWTGPSRPDVEGRVAAGVRPGAGVRMDGAVRAAEWGGFSTRSYRAGLRWTPDPGAGVTLHASGARGSRGVARPWLGRADTISFEEYRGGASLSLGSYRLSGLAALQDLSRQLPFSATFDRGVTPVPDARLLVGQGSVEGPIVPVGAILDEEVSPVVLDVSYRRSRNEGPNPLLYVPLNLVRAEVGFVDEFFQGDLGVRLRFDVRYRSAMYSVNPASRQAEAVPSRTTADWGVVLRVVDARIWYRTENANRILRGNLAGQQYPPIRYSFGIKWSFRN